MSTTDTSHSTPPAVELDAAGRDRDIPLVTLDLAGGGIDRSMVRQLANALAGVNGAYWLRIIAAGGPGSQVWVDRVVGAARTRGVFQVDLTHDAAAVLYERLGEALTVAETTCRRDGCDAVGLFDGVCAAHAEALHVRRAR